MYLGLLLVVKAAFLIEPNSDGEGQSQTFEPLVHQAENRCCRDKPCRGRLRLVAEITPADELYELNSAGLEVSRSCGKAFNIEFLAAPTDRQKPRLAS